MKQICLLFFVLCNTCSFAQKTEHSPKVIVIQQVDDSIFFSEKEIYIESLNFAFDSCNFYSNHFKTTFEIENKTKQTILCPSAFITWYDSQSLREYSGEPLILKPKQKGTVTIESVVYSKRRMTSPGFLRIQTQDGKTLEIPMRLKYVYGKVVCLSN